jgi:hypothetical protein
VFNYFRINYVYIFELDPRNTMSYKVGSIQHVVVQSHGFLLGSIAQEVFSECCSMSIVFLVNFLLFYKVGALAFHN